MSFRVNAQGKYYDPFVHVLFSVDIDQSDTEVLLYTLAEDFQYQYMYRYDHNDATTSYNCICFESYRSECGKLPADLGTWSKIHLACF